MAGPLAGLRVLDFSTLLPGPLCTLMLAEAGADVLKVERAGTGDPMRSHGPWAGAGDSARFAALNRGKASVQLDLKAPDDAAHALRLAQEADVLVEQFRPGVMSRLGLGYDEVRTLNPGVVYCSITGYGQTGPSRHRAGHDLNYMAESGLLSLVTDQGRPRQPVATFADVGAGSYPAFMNIVLALHARAGTGVGTHLDVSMTDLVLTFGFWGFAGGSVGQWPVPDGELLTGGSPRYAVYRTADDEHLAVAALEPQFWSAFCRCIELPEELRDDSVDPEATRRAVAERIAARPVAAWSGLVESEECCVSRVRTMAQARDDEHYRARGVFDGTALSPGGAVVDAVPLPVLPPLRRLDQSAAAPGLGRAPSGAAAERSSFDALVRATRAVDPAT